MRTRILTLLAFFVVLSPTAVFAHIGHGGFDGITLWHYITSPLHLISVIAILSAVILGVRYYKKRQIS